MMSNWFIRQVWIFAILPVSVPLSILKNHGNTSVLQRYSKYFFPTIKGLELEKNFWKKCIHIHQWEMWNSGNHKVCHGHLRKQPTMALQVCKDIFAFPPSSAGSCLQDHQDLTYTSCCWQDVKVLWYYIPFSTFGSWPF